MRTITRCIYTVILLFSAMAMHAQTRDFTFSNSALNEGLSVESNTRSGLQMRHALKQISLVTITDNGYSGEVIEGGSGICLPATAGEPNLPSFSRFVAIPNGATAHIEMSYRSMTVVRNVDLMAAAPLKFDTDDSPNTYERNQSIYSKNAFYPEQPVTISTPFSLRGVQTVAVTVVPYQYNPVTQELRVYDDLLFDVRFDGGDGHFGDDRLRSPYWDPILMQNLANYNQLPVIDYEARMQEWVTNRPEGCEYLIVIPNNESFRQYANQLAEYRIKQGIITEVKSLSDMGCTTTSMMKSYFHNAYNSWDIPPVAVLLLGDHNTNMSQGIPAETTYHSPSYGYCITDNGYADVTGDNLPEMAFCRLVAANPTEAQMMVSKQIEYEYTNPNMNASTYDQPITALGWQTQRWFQICSETVGGYWRQQGKHPVRINAIYSGTPGNSWSSNSNTSIVVNYFGPNGRGYIPQTPAELGGWTGGTGQQVVQAVNNGCMLLQHRDHGYYQGWGEPDFSNSHVAQMTNTGKLTFVNTINCQTGTFDYGSDCLIEAFMRRTSGGQNAGAVGCIGPTQTSYSFVNDTYVWGLFDQYDPQFLPNYGPYANYEGNWRPAFGNVAGKYFLQQSSWPTNPDNKAITHKMFTAHCDAFLTLYTQVPTAMTVTHPSQITASTTSINVSAPAGAVIALTRNNNILAVATATGNSQNISFAAQPSNTNITIVATKQDRLRYVGTIHVISEPSLTVTNITLADSNDNGQLEYGEQSAFNISIKNIGDLASASATMTLATTSQQYVTITENTTTIPALSPNQTIDLTNVFGIQVADNVPNQTRLSFALTINDGSHSWRHEFVFAVNAPTLKVIDGMTVNDGGSEKGNGNGRLDPGENAEVTFVFTNNGATLANNAIATLSTLSQQYVSIANPTITTPIVNPNDLIEVTYSVSVSANMPRGDAALFNLQVVSGGYSDQCSVSHRVGLEIANFENGLDDFEWINDPEHPWTITNVEPYSGLYCLQSGNIGNNESSTLSLQFNVENEVDEIRFFRKVSCDNSDFLKFYIDGTEAQQYSGLLSWREMVFPVTQGEHTFTWTYEKDGSGTSGADHVYIDEILFPVRHIDFACSAGADQHICQVAAQLNANAIGYESLLWTTSGDGNFDHNDILNPIYTPGEQDLVNKMVTLTLTATGLEGDILSDDVIIRFHEAASIVMDDEGEICADASINLSAEVYETSFVNWTTNGDGNFESTTSLTTNYLPGTQDIANGSVTLTLNATSPYGCGDASHDYLLTIHPLQNTEFDMSACVAYTWNGIEYHENGDYEQTLQSIHGCDSTVVMHLTLIDSYNIETEETACDRYEWAGETLMESGTYEHTFTSIHGCDSIVIMHLTINESYNPSAEITLAVDACDSYEWDGIVYTESGIYERIYTDIHGCDSTVVIDLAVMTAPVIETINGDTEVDVRLSPTSVYTTAPSNGTFWSINPEEAGTVVVEEGIATIAWSETFKGEVTLHVWALGYCGDDESSMTINVKNSTDVNEYNINANIYPNPTYDIVKLCISQDSDFMVNIYNDNGILVATIQNETEISFKGMAAGVYHVEVLQNGQRWSKKVIKM